MFRIRISVTFRYNGKFRIIARINVVIMIKITF